MMTVATTIFGLVPIFWEEGAGSEVMRRMAAPMVGGLVSSLVLTLIVIPAIYAIWKGWGLQIGEFATPAQRAPWSKKRRVISSVVALIVFAGAGGVFWLKPIAGGPGQVIYTETVDGLNVELSTPKLVHGKDVVFWLRLTDESGAFVSDADVSMEVYMPAMPSMGMPEMRSSQTATRRKNRYESKLTLEAGGAWEFRLHITRNGKHSKTAFPFVAP
jgi:hypothetical protein